MSQQLIIQNDEDADYVQFTVEIPDGYAGFNISSINGTMINQNYLNIGDVIRFKFSNNPIVYNDAPYITVTDYTSDMRLKTTKNDETYYEFMKFDLFNIYRVKFIPIYSYYDSDEGLSAYIFNPADDSQLLLEPTRKISDYAIQTGDNPIYAPFTGAFIIGLDIVTKIDDIDITIGESIANSKTQPTDITLNEAGEITASNQIGSTYNYGSYWRYDVHNLLMNHRLTVITADEEINETVKLCFYLGRVETEDEPTFYTSSLKSINITELITYKFKFSNRPSPYFYFYYYDGNRFDKIRNTINIQLDKRCEAMIVKKVQNSSNYEEIKYTKYSVGSPTPYLPDGCKIPGSTMNDTNYAIAEIKYNEVSETYETEFKPISFPVMNDAYYTGNNVIIEVRGNNDLANATITFTDFNTFQLIICDGQTKYNISIDTDSELQQPATQDTVVFYQYQSSVARKTGIQCILGQSIQLDNHQRYQFIRTVNTGYIGSTDSSEEGRIHIYETDNKNEEEEADENDIDYNLKLSEPIQLTSIDGEPADDDLVIKHIKSEKETDKDGLYLYVPPLSNNKYMCSKVSGKNRYKTTFEMMTGSGNVPSKVFIPKKSNNPLVPYTNSNLTLVDGLMMIQDVFGDNLKELSNDESNLFLATGHETLNVSPPQSDDYKFKTFNGSITFDRSLTKITRLFSMSNTNSCIGYINDILSAKLSRYYFAANYGIFNVYFNNSSFISFSNSMNQIKAIYNEFKDKTYSGIHEVLLANCGDIVKLIGSDVVTNNCMPGITPEEHIINADEVVDFNNINDIESIDMKPFYYKLFHYYNSGFNNYPSIGGDSSKPNGASFLHNHSSFIIQTNDEYTNAPGISSQHAIFISNKSRAINSITYNDKPVSGYTNIETVGDMTIDFLKELENNSSNKHVSFSSTFSSSSGEPTVTKTVNCGGFINVLPCPRVYRNNNFEQSDLTISTGRIKTLSPIYIQSVNRILLNNILYMFDMMINIIETKYEGIKNTSGVYDYFLVLNDSLDSLPENGEAVLKRFGLSPVDEDSYSPLSFDSALIMNYLNSSTVNDYTNVEELLQSLPIKDNEANNEEIIENIITFRPETNIQLFSSRYFNFHENISSLSEIVWVQVLNQSADLNDKNLWMYFGVINDANNADDTYVCLTEYINNFYSSIVLNNSYNICRTVKTMISKLGEFLDFPKIVFGTTLAFNQSKTVNIQYMNPVNYASEFQTHYNVNSKNNVTSLTETFTANQKQKNNVAMFGVIFKYHQLSLGWQQMINDIQETFIISRAKGQKHFVVKIYDEFGRQIPNMDTSQGFKNNLRLEINCVNS